MSYEAVGRTDITPKVSQEFYAQRKTWIDDRQKSAARRRRRGSNFPVFSPSGPDNLNQLRQSGQNDHISCARGVHMNPTRPGIESRI